MDTASAEASADGASRLVQLCLGRPLAGDSATEIRAVLRTNIDWTAFAQQVTGEQAEIPVAHRLLAAAPDLLPQDIRTVFAQIIERAERDNEAILDEIRRSSGKGALEAQRAMQRALTIAQSALREDPADGAAWRELADFFIESRLFKEAIICCDRAIALAPSDAMNWLARARAMSGLGRRRDSLPYIDKALELDPADARAWTRRAYALADLQRYPEVLESSGRALALDPGNVAAKRVGIESRLFVCDWRRRMDDKKDISERLKAGQSMISPVHHRAVSDSEAEQLVLARFKARNFPPAAKPLWSGEAYRHDKIRVAYISTDFRDHVVADAIAGCLELHDRRRFETTGISLGRNDGSAMRKRMEGAFDRFVDVRTRSDAEVAAILRALEIDIIVDLNGYSGDARTNILAFRPVPVQLCWFGYPGTMALPYIDYIIADSWLIPAEHQAYYTEQVVYLPHTYLPSDRKRPLGAEVPSRVEAGLPATGFVFACLHNAFKIGPQIFDIWTRLLRDVEGSIMWLLADNATAVANLKREATLRGVDPDRLVFAPRKPLAEHIARLKLGDLYLDTLPYCAHTSASDALWAGLPLLTCPGNTFAGRVAAPLLHAIGLPELVVASLAEYEDLARALAHDPDRLAGIKARLVRNRDTQPLFDTAGFTRHLEAAYQVIRERQRSGLPPESFAVKPTP